MGRYKYAYGFEKGLSHFEDNIPCQDNALFLEKNGVSIGVVSDGCGSKPCSEIGSEITVRVVANFLADNFDDLVRNGFDMANKGAATVNTRKRLIMSIINEELDYIKDHKEELKSFADKAKEKYVLENDEDYLDLLCATLIFYAEKDKHAIYGQVGDGILGLVYNGKLRIALEEKKNSGESNVTIYPCNLYEKSKNTIEGDNWFKMCRMRMISAEGINGAILTSDGVPCKMRPAPFKRRYRDEYKTFFRKIAEYKTEEERNKITNDYLERFRDDEDNENKDDVSFVLMCTEDCVVSECEIKDYPRPNDTNNQNNQPVVVENPRPQEPQIEVIDGVNPETPEEKELRNKYLGLARNIYSDVEDLVFVNIRNACFKNKKLEKINNVCARLTHLTGKKKLELSLEDIYSYYVDLLSKIHDNGGSIKINDYQNHLEEDFNLIMHKQIKFIVQILIEADDKIIKDETQPKELTCSRV